MRTASISPDIGYRHSPTRPVRLSYAEFSVSPSPSPAPVSQKKLRWQSDIAQEGGVQQQTVEELRRAPAIHGGEHATRFVHVVGSSRAIQRVFALVERVAPTDAGVLLTGESGVGKELIAEAIHQRKVRRSSAHNRR